MIVAGVEELPEISDCWKARAEMAMFDGAQRVGG